MTPIILDSKGRSYQRIVRSQRMYKGVRIGAIRHKGYLILVRFDGNLETNSGLWTQIDVIRKLK